MRGYVRALAHIPDHVAHEVPTVGRVIGIRSDMWAIEGEPTVFTVTMSEATSIPVSFDFSTGQAPAGELATAGLDYVASSGRLTFAPGELEKSFAVAIIDDTLPETYEQYEV